MEKKDFFITSIGDLLDPFDLIATVDTLNNNIKLSDFGGGVRNVSFYALTYYDSTGINEPFWSYDPVNKKIEGSLPIDFIRASSYVDKKAQKLVCDAIFELFDKVSDQVDDFDLEALKKAMLQAVDTNPTFTEKIRFRVYSDVGVTTGDIPEFSNAIDLSKYGGGVERLFFEVSFFKKPQIFLSDAPKFDEGKRGLYISVISSLDISQFSSELDKAIEKVKPQVKDFDFDLFKADIIHFAELLQETA